MELLMRPGPVFDEEFRERFEDLLRWRRDVRSFRGDPVDPRLLEHLIGLAALAPSVGYSQPWRFILVQSEGCRECVRSNFERSNQNALRAYDGEKAKLYATLKLAGLREAPVHLAVYLDSLTKHGDGLGRATMPETLEYSAVLSVYTFWLAARAYGLGVGWVSILDAAQVNRDLQLPDDWKLIAYLCVGYPAEEHTEPELLRQGWESRLDPAGFVLRR
jgi:5,6-dimethylbenzimidazole synthase